MFIFALTIYQYSLFDITGMIGQPTAPFLYYKSLIGKLGSSIFFSQLFLIDHFHIDLYYPYSYFYFIINELFYFILFTPILFICYKKNYRLDMILIFGFIILFIGKIVFCAVFNSYMKEDDDKLKSYLFYLQNTNSDLISNNLLFNITYPIIGMIFGLMHYSIEKGLKVQSKRRFAKIGKI